MKKPTDLPEEHQKFLIRIGKKLRTIRKDQSKSYETMAEDIGLQRTTYNLLEQGKLNFQFSTLLQVLSYHKISISDFFKDL
ncbi:MAG: helix-turn-helix transcriptional regulator [Candidatus Methanofastidiosa archaeon]|nr:helix-turn-helix transcriptional regulator [Candidatus Methanofastidiosa archaeon]